MQESQGTGTATPSPTPTPSEQGQDKDQGHEISAAAANNNDKQNDEGSTAATITPISIAVSYNESDSSDSGDDGRNTSAGGGAAGGAVATHEEEEAGGDGNDEGGKGDDDGDEKERKDGQGEDPSSSSSSDGDAGDDERNNAAGEGAGTTGAYPMTSFFSTSTATATTSQASRAHSYVAYLAAKTGIPSLISQVSAIEEQQQEEEERNKQQAAQSTAFVLVKEEKPRRPVAVQNQRLAAILDEELPEVSEVGALPTVATSPPIRQPKEAPSVIDSITAAVEERSTKPSKVFCEECEDQEATVLCSQCHDKYCNLCFFAQHRKGSRSSHIATNLDGSPISTSHTTTVESMRPSATATPSAASTTPDSDDDSNSNTNAASSDDDAPPLRRMFWSYYDSYYRSKPRAFKPPPDSAKNMRSKESETVAERARYIPLRLTLEERKLLRLLEAVLNASKYTDRVDAVFKSPAARMQQQVKNICSLLSGILSAWDNKAGQELLEDRDFAKYEKFFQQVFEIGRRHKIMNPEKMRTQYAMMVYLLQDSCSVQIRELLGFSLVKKITTVYSYLEERGALGALTDDFIVCATSEVVQAPEKSRYDIQREIKIKERAIEHIGNKYANANVNAEQIKVCLYSVCDNNSFLRSNRDPIDKMIDYLKTMFAGMDNDPLCSLAIYGIPSIQTVLTVEGGQDGSRLTHTHERQYLYVLQSLTLWREIQHNMFKLWILAEEDMLKPGNAYELRNTGQGLNRVQSSPQIYRVMHTILHTTQRTVGTWVGSSVVHLGDHNVPNALNFIDKYTQVPRILNPIVLTLSHLAPLADNELVGPYFNATFGGINDITKRILVDFFRHAFDGSGADNFYDAGSCIDGRLTSAWNWCNTLERKEFFSVFLLAGFVGFDGEWK
ncbi:UPF0652 protein [Pelomyxa schiedti]|nr:UPF0652 protein [Pelomyxa schiedti]